MADWKHIVPFVTRWEGGFVNDPDDAGGATNKGVTIAVWRRYCRENHRSDGNVEGLKRMTKADWTNIMKSKYWDTINGDFIKSQKVADILFSICWGSGAGNVPLHLAKVIGVRDTPKSKRCCDALNKEDGEALFNKLVEVRRDFFLAISRPGTRNYKFRKGWLNRLNALVRYEGGSTAGLFDDASWADGSSYDTTGEGRAEMPEVTLANGGSKLFPYDILNTILLGETGANGSTATNANSVDNTDSDATATTTTFNGSAADKKTPPPTGAATKNAAVPAVVPPKDVDEIARGTRFKRGDTDKTYLGGFACCPFKGKFTDDGQIYGDKEGRFEATVFISTVGENKIYAPMAGTVVSKTDWKSGGVKKGDILVIEIDGTVPRYGKVGLYMGEFDAIVKKGDHVAAGQQIATGSRCHFGVVKESTMAKKKYSSQGPNDTLNTMHFMMPNWKREQVWDPDTDGNDFTMA